MNVPPALHLLRNHPFCYWASLGGVGFVRQWWALARHMFPGAVGIPALPPSRCQSDGIRPSSLLKPQLPHKVSNTCSLPRSHGWELREGGGGRVGLGEVLMEGT